MKESFRPTTGGKTADVVDLFSRSTSDGKKAVTDKSGKWNSFPPGWSVEWRFSGGSKVRFSG